MAGYCEEPHIFFVQNIFIYLFIYFRKKDSCHLRQYITWNLVELLSQEQFSKLNLDTSFWSVIVFSW